MTGNHTIESLIRSKDRKRIVTGNGLESNRYRAFRKLMCSMPTLPLNHSNLNCTGIKLDSIMTVFRADDEKEINDSGIY